MKRETFCKQLGFKQEDLATYLEVSVHQMAQYEAGKRRLPSASASKETRMHLVHRQLQKENAGADLPEFTRAQHEKTAKILKRHANTNNYNAQTAERKLEDLQKKYEQANNVLILMQAMDANEPEGTLDKLWFSLMKRKALKKLELNGLAAQTKWQLRIAGLRQQEAKAREMMKTLGEGISRGE